MELIGSKTRFECTQADLYRQLTLREFADHLSGRRDAPSPSKACRCLECIREGSGGTAVVSVVTNLQSLLKSLPASAPIWWLKLDGLHVWPPRDLTIPAQARIHVDEIDAVIPSGKLLVYGYSYGGLLALEIADRLRRDSRREAIPVVLEPAWPWGTREPMRSRMMRHGHALAKLGTAGRLRHVLSRCVAVVRGLCSGTTRRTLLRLRLALTGRIPVETRWAYLESSINMSVRDYGSAAALSVDAHLVGRASYLRDSLRDWSRLTSGGAVIAHSIADDLSHLEVVELENSNVWLTVIQQMLASSDCVT